MDLSKLLEPSNSAGKNSSASVASTSRGDKQAPTYPQLPAILPAHSEPHQPAFPTYPQLHATLLARSDLRQPSKAEHLAIFPQRPPPTQDSPVPPGQHVSPTIEMGSNRPHTTYYNQDIIERGKVKFVVPVDLRSASTAIREKRRVNAAATLKYRAKQRKEEELAIQIQCLEQQLREAREEAERYRAEMNYFKDLVQPLTTERHDRPPSPRHAWKANSEGDR